MYINKTITNTGNLCVLYAQLSLWEDIQLPIRLPFQCISLIQTFSTQGGNCYNERKQELQSSLVETTFDLKALASDLQQVETVSFQPVGPSVRNFLASTRSSLDKYYHFPEDFSDKHGVDYMWGLIAHVILDVNAVSGTSRGLGKVTECVKQTKHLFSTKNSTQHWESNEKQGCTDRWEFVKATYGQLTKNNVCHLKHVKMRKCEQSKSMETQWEHDNSIIVLQIPT